VSQKISGLFNPATEFTKIKQLRPALAMFSFVFRKMLVHYFLPVGKQQFLSF